MRYEREHAFHNFLVQIGMAVFVLAALLLVNHLSVSGAPQAEATTAPKVATR